jgi:hypothetical protein
VVKQIADILHWFIDTPTVGGLIVTGAYSTAFVLFVVMARWILAGGRVPDAAASTPGDEEENADEGA